MGEDSYSDRVKKILSDYKINELHILKPGCHNGNLYDHILPKEESQKNFFNGLRKPEGIKWQGEDHLNSSQVLCFNLFYPNIDNLQIFEPYFREKARREGFQEFGKWAKFEYTNGWLLHEETPTNVDFAVVWKDDHSEKNLFLFEFKYTEDSFGTCNYKEKVKCPDLEVILEKPQECYLTRKEVKYWRYLKNNDPIKIDQLLGNDECPFKGGLYQLMRNQLLAKRIEETSDYSKVIFGAIYPKQNKSIDKQLNKIHVGDNKTVKWEELLVNPSRFIRIPLEDLFSSAINQHGLSPSWREFMIKKHGHLLGNIYD
jgi:hypothetical protein